MPYRKLRVGSENYSLRLSINGLISFEEAYGGSITAFGEKFNVEEGQTPDIAIKDIRLLLWAALQDQHPDVDVVQAGEIMQQAGGLNKTMEPLMSAFNDAFPNEEGESSEPSANGSANGSEAPKEAAEAETASTGTNS